jgi:hypothetical protein
MMATTYRRRRTVRLLEFTRAAGPRGLIIDRARSVIRNCKFLGQAGNSDYPRSTRERALARLEGARVYIDHPAPGHRGPRSYRDQIGRARNLEERGDGIYGDFHFNPRHVCAEQMLWDAENSPDSVGFSINATGRGRDVGGRYVVEELLTCESIDLVCRPATTRGIHEAWGGRPPAAPAGRLTLSQECERTWRRALALGLLEGRGQAPPAEADVAQLREQAVARMRNPGRDLAAEAAARLALVERLRRVRSPAGGGTLPLQEQQVVEQARAAEVRRLRSIR